MSGRASPSIVPGHLYRYAPKGYAAAIPTARLAVPATYAQVVTVMRRRSRPLVRQGEGQRGTAWTERCGTHPLAVPSPR
jgi:hypothetical protein